MKKTCFVWFALVFLGTVVFGQEAYIREVNGLVEVKAAGAPDWVPGEAGRRLERDTMVSTGFGSTAVLDLGSSVMVVEPLTRLTVEEIARTGGGEAVDIWLRAGRVRVDVPAAGGGRTEFRVRSPIATASVRGTSFEFDGIELVVERGRVHMSGGDGVGLYVGAGGEARAELEKGVVIGAGERAREELAPPLPAGLGGWTVDVPAFAPDSPPADVPADIPDSPSTGELDGGIRWE